jgi:hypothetical protein
MAVGMAHDLAELEAKKLDGSSRVSGRRHIVHPMVSRDGGLPTAFAVYAYDLGKDGEPIYIAEVLPSNKGRYVILETWHEDDSQKMWLDLGEQVDLYDGS